MFWKKFYFSWWQSKEDSRSSAKSTDPAREERLKMMTVHIIPGEDMYVKPSPVVTGDVRTHGCHISVTSSGSDSQITSALSSSCREATCWRLHPCAIMLYCACFYGGWGCCSGLSCALPAGKDQCRMRLQRIKAYVYRYVIRQNSLCREVCCFRLLSPRSPVFDE